MKPSMIKALVLFVEFNLVIVIQYSKIKLFFIVGGPPSDISDRSANSDKLVMGEKSSITKKESTGELIFLF